MTSRFQRRDANRLYRAYKQGGMRLTHKHIDMIYDFADSTAPGGPMDREAEDLLVQASDNAKAGRFISAEECIRHAWEVWNADTTAIVPDEEFPRIIFHPCDSCQWMLYHEHWKPYPEMFCTADDGCFPPGRRVWDAVKMGEDRCRWYAPADRDEENARARAILESKRDLI